MSRAEGPVPLCAQGFNFTQKEVLPVSLASGRLSLCPWSVTRDRMVSVHIGALGPATESTIQFGDGASRVSQSQWALAMLERTVM